MKITLLPKLINMQYKVTQKNYSNTKQLGSVVDIKGVDLQK